MSYNTTILSYNKNEEIEEYDPAPSPSISSSKSEEGNELIYHSFYIPSQMSLDDDMISSNNLFHSNTNINALKSYSASPLIYNINNINNDPKTLTNFYSTKTRKIFEKKKINSNINNKTNNNKLIKSMNINSKLNPLLKKKPKRKKLLNMYGSYRNLYENKKYNEKIKKMKTITIVKKDVKETKKEISSGTVTIKNENIENRLEYDKENKKINIYIKNNIYNYNLINDVNNNRSSNIFDSKRSSITKTDIKIPSQEYFYKNNTFNNTLKKNNINKNNKKPSIKIAPMDNINNININQKNISLKDKEINNDKIANITNNKFRFDFPFLPFDNETKKPLMIQSIAQTYKKLLRKFHEIYKKWILYKNKGKIKDRINPILNILAFLDQKDIIEIISLRNKKVMLLMNKSLIDSYYFNIRKNLKKYSNYLEPIKSTLVYTYTKNKSSLKIDLMLLLRFIDKNKNISAQNPKHFQLLYLFDFLKDKNIPKIKNKNKNRLFDCFGFDIIPKINIIENESKKEFKGIYLSKQMSRFNIDKNDELVNIQPILPFKFNDRGIFNFEIFSNQNYFMNPKNIKIKLNILDLYSNTHINELRINEYQNICKYWKKKGGLNEKKMEIYKNIIKEWFDKFFIVKDIFYADIGLSVFKFNLQANNCGVLENDNLNVKIIIKEKDDYIENEIKKNNLLFERNNSFEIRKGENLIFFLSMY